MLFSKKYALSFVDSMTAFDCSDSKSITPLPLTSPTTASNSDPDVPPLLIATALLGEKVFRSPFTVAELTTPDLTSLIFTIEFLPFSKKSD